jgi:hypothetical protein
MAMIKGHVAPGISEHHLFINLMRQDKKKEKDLI